MGIYGMKPWFRARLRSLLPLLRPVHPDALTWAAVAVSAAAAAAIARSGGAGSLALLAVPPLLFLRIALNALDGLLAQETGKARPFGEVLNEATDRLSDSALLLGVSFSPYSSPAFGAPALVSVLLSSYVGILGKAVGASRQYGGVLGKADRMLWLGAACLLVFFAGDRTLAVVAGEAVGVFDALLVAFTALGAMTSLQRARRIHAELAQLRPQRRGPA
jgi:CDP-diacylglycerol--glycerol-3-phosphate 3-phosphatidyltransferase